MLSRLKEVGLTLKGDKCEFRLQRLTFFGHQVTQNGLQPSEEKVAAIRNADPRAERQRGTIVPGCGSRCV